MAAPSSDGTQPSPEPGVYSSLATSDNPIQTLGVLLDTSAYHVKSLVFPELLWWDPSCI